MKKLILLILTIILVGVAQGAQVADNWTVFGPYSDLLNRLPKELVSNVPKYLKVLNALKYAKVVTPKNGKIDFREIYRYRVPRKAFYVCIPIESTKGETINIGIGADWWFDLYLNGQSIGDTLTDGNTFHPPSASDHIYKVTLKPGKNYLVAGVIGGVGSQQMVFKLNPPPSKKKILRPVIQLGEEKLPPLEKVTNFIKENPTKNFIVKLKLEPGKQYCFQWSSQTTKGTMPIFKVQSHPDGGVVYFAKKLTNGRNKSGYFYAETPEPYGVLEIPKNTQNEISRFSLKQRFDTSARFQDWRTQRYPLPKGAITASKKIVTPHFDLATNLPGAKLNIFTIGPFWLQRNQVELEQRFNFKTNYLFLPGHSLPPEDHYVRDANNKVILQSGIANMKLAEKANCILLDGCGASAITKDMAKKIIEQVKNGAGLVINGFDQPYYPYKDGRKKEQAIAKFRSVFAEIFKNKTTQDINYVKVSAAENLVADFVALGKGRAVLLIDAKNVYGIDRINYEIRSALMGKAILWATKNIPHVQVNATSNNSKVEINVANKVAQKTTISAVIADMSCNVLKKEEIVAKAGKNILTNYVKELGKYPVILTSKQNGKSQDFDIVIVENQGANVIKNVVVKTHAPMIRCDVTLNRKANKGELLSISVVDSNDNVWVSKRQYITNKTTIYIKADNFPVYAGKLNIALISKDGKKLDEVTQSVMLKSRAQIDDYKNPNFGLGIWGVPIDSYLSKLYHQTLETNYDIDFSLTANHRVSPWQLLDMGIVAAPNGIPGQIYFGQNNKVTGKPNEPERILCLSSPKLKKQLAANAKLLLTPLKNYPAKFLFGDHETNLLGYINKAATGTDYCFSPSCKKSLQELVKKEYGSLAKLNSTWKTNFAKWSDVTPIVLNEALKTNNAARWIDHRRNMDKVWTNLTQFRLKEIQKYIPNAKYYVQNLHSSYNSNDSFSGIDFEQLFACNLGACAMPESYINAFTKVENKVLNAQGGSMWPPFGGSVDDASLGALRAGKVVWQSLLMGQNNCLYYLHNWVSHSKMFYNDIFMVYPDLSTSMEGNSLAKTLKQARSGVDRLLLSVDKDNSGIEMLYSRSSEHSFTFLQAANKNNAPLKEINPRVQQFEFFAPAIETSNYSYSSCASSLLANNGLQKRNAKVLILPFAQSISLKDAEIIRQFVKNGGTVIADFRPAISNEHGAFEKAGLLDDVFGIKQNLTWQDNFTKGKVSISHTVGKATFYDAIIGSQITLNGAKAHGKVGQVPLLLENNFGRGKAILLNFATKEVNFHKFFGKLLSYSNAVKLFDLTVRDIVYESDLGPVKSSSIKVERNTVKVEKDKSSTEDAGEREALIYGNTSIPKLYRLTNGPSEIIGYFACRRGFALGKGKMALDIKVRQSGHVYDLITNKYLGKCDSWSTTIPVEGVIVYAVLPFKVVAPNVEVESTKRTNNGYYEVNVKLSLTKEAEKMLYPVKVSFVAPNGKLFDLASQTISVRNASAIALFTLPKNAPKGQWFVQAREVFGGNVNSVKFTIK